MSPPSDDDEVSPCYSSSSDDNEVTRMQSQSLEGEVEEDDNTDDATDCGRTAVTHIEHFNQHDRQRRYRQRR
jgi:hypothetical protein